MTALPINDDSRLDECCRSLEQAQWVTVDTEFMRERTYYPQLCLIQACADGYAWCIDALAPIDLDRVFSLLCTSESTRVLHAARQDLEIFFHRYGSFNSPLFDTQIAAGLLGFDAQIGYGGMIKHLLGKELEKGYQRANWAKRPLPDGQLEYALDDVLYLAEAYPVITAKLQDLGRLDWVLEDSQRLLDRELYVTDPSRAWLRIGQLRTLPATEQQIVRSLAEWREQVAQASDRPRNWIGSDSTLVYLAQIKPDSPTRLRKVKGISPELLERESENILQAIADGLDGPGDRLLSQPKPLTDSEQKLYKQLKQKLDQCARSLAIETPALGTRRDVEQLLRGNEASLLLQGWRKQVIGEVLLAMC